MPRRAATIARDQIGKLNGEMNQLRQTNLGVRRYRWSTSQDERVRDGHRKLNGTIQLWAKPPVVDERTGERGHPGQPIQCRCSAIPIIDDVLADAGLIDPMDVELTHPTPGEQPPLRRVAPPPAPMPPTPPRVPPPVAPPPPLPVSRPPAAKAPPGPPDSELLAVQKLLAAQQARTARNKLARAAEQRGSAEAALSARLTASQAEREAELEAEQAIVREAERAAALAHRRAAAPKRKAARRRTAPPPKKRKQKPDRAQRS